MDSGAIRRRSAALLAALITSVLLALAAPGTAQAAPSSCPGRKVRTLSFSTGQVLIYKSGGSVCAITFAKNPGPQRRISVSLQARGHVAVERVRKHSRSSVPVTVYVGHRSVKVRGSVGSGTYTSGWILF
ncbi:hypothetical protein ABZ614_14880 [Streptomyces sp. NPDC013178]|uniref:hypothetical protein n=1 Tax=unclassified Streptomyces TaxID=2593676 RepID=UPI0033D640FD